MWSAQSKCGIKMQLEKGFAYLTQSITITSLAHARPVFLLVLTLGFYPASVVVFIGNQEVISERALDAYLLTGGQCGFTSPV